MIWPTLRPESAMARLLTFAEGTGERAELQAELERMRGEVPEIPLIIGGREVRTGRIHEIRAPHDKDRVLARAHLAGPEELTAAVAAAREAHPIWSPLDWYQRAAVFRKAADILEERARIRHIAVIMEELSKTPYEAEIDLLELVDFWRFNVHYTRVLYEQQPEQFPGEINRFDWRPLEGFVLAISPFNFYSIGGNLPTAPAMVGNVALWKPARAAILSSFEIMQVLGEAGLPPGVVSFVPFDSADSGILLEHPDLTGLHFTGSYETFLHLQQEIARNLPRYRAFPRIVGEAGGKDFLFVHCSADPVDAAANMIRGGFEYQGQKCSAASRAYIPDCLWPPIRDYLLRELPRLTLGPPGNLGSFMGAVIDEKAFRKIVGYIEHARENPDDYEVLFGGGYDDREGWFVQPTVILSKEPKSRLMTEEVFGPVLTVYRYASNAYEETLRLCDETSPYGLTGSIFARDRVAVAKAEEILRFAAGNFYINDKPTGAIVSRQPFGGARHSGTNDKAGFWLNLARWMSPRNIKETMLEATDWRRPYQG